MKELDDIIVEIDGRGKFQRTLIFGIFGPLFFLQPLPWMNELLILKVPDHWCNHPMTNALNDTEIIKWKKCYIPIKDTDGSYDQCHIYHKENNHDLEFWNHTEFINCPSETLNSNNTQAVMSEVKKVMKTPCKLGWKFDQSEFESTIVTEYNWVCNDSHHVPDVFTFAQIGFVIGSVILSYLADLCGRRPILWVIIALIVGPMVAKTFLAYNFYAYIVLNILAAAGMVSIYSIPANIIMEIVDSGYRSKVMMFNWIIW